MAGLVPAIHVFVRYTRTRSVFKAIGRNNDRGNSHTALLQDVDGRDKPGHDRTHIMPPVFRFAPSPNGYLHLGHAFSALLNLDLARRANGRFLLRIEDIDTIRCKPEFEAAISEDLGWLGIAWEAPVRRQSEHFAFYRDAIEKLSAEGLVYPSFESRAEIAN